MIQGEQKDRYALDQTSLEMAEALTHSLYQRVGKEVFGELNDDLLRRFADSKPSPVGTCDAVAATTYLRLVLVHLEKVLAHMASGYSATRWLWYLRRLPDFVFEGNIPTTQTYDSALAETVSGVPHSGADNLRVRGESLRYAVEGAVARRVLRFCHGVRLMSSVHRLLRYAGKGVSFTFNANHALPSPVPKPEEEEAIRLYDRRMATLRGTFIRGGTTITSEINQPRNGVLTVHRMSPEWLPSVMIGASGKPQDVRVFSRFLPQIVSFDQLKALNSDPRLSGTMSVGSQASALFALLSVAPHFVARLGHGLVSLMQYGYIVILDDLLISLLDECMPSLVQDLGDLLPGQTAHTSGQEIVATLENISGSLWPLRVGPVVRKNQYRVWLDLHAATALLDALLEFPRTAGDAAANARADHFEDSVQRVIYESGWAPSPKLRHLLGRNLRLEGAVVSDIDALGARNRTLILVSCKSVIYSGAYDVGDYRVVRNVASTVQDGATYWQNVVSKLQRSPMGDNFDLREYDDFVPVVCTPFPVYVPIGVATQEVRPGLRAVVSEEELASWLKEHS